MKNSGFGRIYIIVLLGLWLTFAGSVVAGTGAYCGLYLQHMSPSGADAKNFSEPGFGGGFNIVVPVPQVHNFLAADFGFEVVNLLSETIPFQDPQTKLRVEQQTSQDYFRIYLGGRVGSHGNGFIRPFAGSHLGYSIYNISTDVVIPDDSDRENEIRQNLDSETKGSFGFDLNFGLDFNFNNKIIVESGMRYIKSFNLVQQLGEGSVEISPEYYQFYVGVAVNIGWIISQGEETDGN